MNIFYKLLPAAILLLSTDALAHDKWARHIHMNGGKSPPMSIFIDPETGCQYLYGYGNVRPRLSADGESVFGCREKRETSDGNS